MTQVGMDRPVKDETGHPIYYGVQEGVGNEDSIWVFQYDRDGSRASYDVYSDQFGNTKSFHFEYELFDDWGRTRDNW